MKIWGEIKEKGSDGPSAAEGVVEREVWYDATGSVYVGNVFAILPLI